MNQILDLLFHLPRVLMNITLLASHNLGLCHSLLTTFYEIINFALWFQIPLNRNILPHVALFGFLVTIPVVVVVVVVEVVGGIIVVVTTRRHSA